MKSPSSRLLAGRAALCLLLLTAALPSSAEIESFGRPSILQNAMGGFHAALADGFDLLLSNPAGLADAKRQTYISQLGLVADSSFLSLAGAYFSGDAASVLASSLSSSNYKMQSRGELAGPICFGMEGQGLGFGIFNRTGYSVKAVSSSSITISLDEDILVVGGYAYRMELGGGHCLDLGFLAKGFVRASPSLSADSGSISTLAEPMVLIAAPFTFTAGIGIDLGLRWNWEEKIAAGLVCRDAYSPAIVSSYSSLMGFLQNPSASVSSTGYDTVAPDLDAGLLWKPDWGGYSSYINSVSFALDYDGILDLFSAAPRSPLLNISLGAELKVLDILTIRAGMKDLLPSAGVGFDLTAVKVNAGLYGKEYGSTPWEDSSYRLEISFEFLYQLD